MEVLAAPAATSRTRWRSAQQLPVVVLPAMLTATEKATVATASSAAVA